MKSNIIAVLLVVIVGAPTLAATRAKTTVKQLDEIKIAVPFAVSVGVPVAPFGPYFYSYQQFGPQRAETRHSQSGAFSPGPQTGSALPVVGDGAKRSRLADSLIATRCATCHGGAAPKAELSLEQIENLSTADRLSAIRTVVTGQMPKGGKLSPEELREVIKELTSQTPRRGESK